MLIYVEPVSESVIEGSFVMIPGIGPKKEETLWSHGITNFEDFIKASDLPGISRKRLRQHQIDAIEIQSRMQSGNFQEIAELMPDREKWRLLSMIGDRFAALDIESIRFKGRNLPVVLSLCMPDGKCITLVKGENLNWSNMDRLLSEIDFILTFNGSSFDFPLLVGNGFKIKGPVHIDLRRFSRRAGLQGGLKRIETEMGINRPRELEFSTDSQTSYLWNLWTKKGSKRAIDLLIQYNQQDAASLIPLSKLIYQRLRVKKLMSLERNIASKRKKG